jgi:hypothetical protein
MKKTKDAAIISKKKYEKGKGWIDQHQQVRSLTTSALHQLQSRPSSEQLSPGPQILSAPRRVVFQESLSSSPAFQAVGNMFAAKTTAPASGGLTISTSSTPLL